MSSKVILKAAISMAWLALWSTPVFVCVSCNSILLTLIGIMWAIIMHAFTKAYAPKWILTAWEAVFPAEQEETTSQQVNEATSKQDGK